MRFSAMKLLMSSGNCTPSRAALFLMMASLVSKSGGATSTIRPHSNRVCSRSSSWVISRGGRSEVSTICRPDSYRVLKV